MRTHRANRRLSAILRRVYRHLYRDPAAVGWVSEAERLQAQLQYRREQGAERATSTGGT